MRKYAAVAVMVVVLCALASAQMEHKPLVIPNNELFFGYSYLTTTTSGPKVDPSLVYNRTGLNGVSFEYADYFAGRYGAMLQMYHGSNSQVDRTGVKYSATNYLVGPTARVYQHGFWLGSAHLLGGVEHATYKVPYTATTLIYSDWRVAAGGGVTVDGTLSRHVGVRLAQVDYLFSNHYKSTQSGLRYTGGLTIRF